MKILPILIFSLFIFSSIKPSNSVQIEGYGGTFTQFLYAGYNFMFKLQKANTTVVYKIGSTDDIVNSVKNRSVLFGSTQTLLSESDYKNFTDLQMYPIISGPLIAIFNLPGVSELQMDRETIGQVFTEDIVWWNDTRITSQNPNVTIPSLPITKVIRAETSGTTLSWTTTLTKLSTTFASKIGSVRIFNSSVTSGKRYKGVVGNDAVAAYVRVNEGTIGYITQSVTVQAPLPFVYMINADGKLVKDPIQGGVEASRRALFTSRFTADLIDLPGNDTWPSVAFAYLIMHTTNTDKCEELREFLKFLFFAMKNVETRSLASSYGFCPLAESLADQVQQKMQNITCNNAVVGRSILIPQHKSGGYIALFVLGSIGIFLSVCYVALYMTYLKVVSKSEIIYVFVSEFGAILGFVGVFTWALQPLNDYLCLGRAWLTSLSVTIILASLCSRLFQIFMIYRYYLNLKEVTRTLLNLWLIVSFLVFLALELVIMILWSSIDKYKRVVVTFNLINLTDDLGCNSSNMKIWMGLLLAHFGLLMLSSIFMIYATWPINNKFGTSKYLVFEVYNILLSVVVVIPILIVSSSSDSYRSLVIGFGLFFLCLSSSFTSMFPKIYMLHQKSRRKSGSEDVDMNSQSKVSQKKAEKECREIMKALKTDKNK